MNSANEVPAPRAAIRTLESAGKYLVKTRNLRAEVLANNATQGATHEHADVQALSILSVALARVVGQGDQPWVKQICDTLHIAEVA